MPFLVTLLALFALSLMAFHEEATVEEAARQYAIAWIASAEPLGTTGRLSTDELSEFRRRRYVPDQVDEFDEFDPGSDRRQRRRDRPRIFDGSRLRTVGQGMLWLSAGIMSICFVLSLIYTRFMPK
jgi:hypothetical protein